MENFDAGKSNGIGLSAKPAYSVQSGSALIYLTCDSEMYREIVQMQISELVNAVENDEQTLSATDDGQLSKAIKNIMTQQSDSSVGSLSLDITPTPDRDTLRRVWGSVTFDFETETDADPYRITVEYSFSRVSGLLSNDFGFIGKITSSVQDISASFGMIYQNTEKEGTGNLLQELEYDAGNTDTFDIGILVDDNKVTVSCAGGTAGNDPDATTMKISGTSHQTTKI